MAFAGLVTSLWAASAEAVAAEAVAGAPPTTTVASNTAAKKCARRIPSPLMLVYLKVWRTPDTAAQCNPGQWHCSVTGKCATGGMISSAQVSDAVVYLISIPRKTRARRNAS